MTDDRVFRKCAWRLMPLIVAGYFANFLDRTNVGFAALTNTGKAKAFLVTAPSWLVGLIFALIGSQFR